MIKLAPDEAIALPVDELALQVLADFSTQHTSSSYNYMLQYKSHVPYLGNMDAQYAIGEAMAWLQSHGMFARPPGETSSDVIFVTRRGQLALAQDVRTVRSMNRLQENLHPLIEQKARRQFLLGEYENAIFVSLKAVEVRVRVLAGYGDEMVGVDLMIKAFKPGGPLADPSAPTGEVEGTMALFRGAYAVLRNPSGHREVSFDDVSEASEAVMTASLLMRMLDRIEARLQRQQSA